MAERSNHVGDIKGSYRSEAVVSQQNAAAISSKRSRISKKADSVSSACGEFIFMRSHSKSSNVRRYNTLCLLSLNYYYYIASYYFRNE